MKKMRLKKKIIFFNKKSDLIVVILLLVFIGVILITYFIGKRVNEKIIGIGISESNKFASLIVTKAVTEEMTIELSTEKLYKIEKNENDEIETIDIDSVVVNQILTRSSLRVQEIIRYIENGEIDKIEFKDSLTLNYDENALRKGIFYMVPIGIVFNNSLLSNLGPKIPIKFSLMGNLVANLNTKIKSYGINNALIESSIHYDITFDILLPFYKKMNSVSIDVPIAIKILSGKVPDYYSGAYNESSPILKLPVE